MPEADYVTTTRIAYNQVAEDYAKLLADDLANHTHDRAVLANFAELVLQTPGKVADVGCGPGRITTHLDALGLCVRGFDLSPAMIEVARKTYPTIDFGVAAITDLPIEDRALAGLIAWYSIIHTPPEALAPVVAEFARVSTPGGWLQLAFQAGNDCVHHAQVYGHAVALDSYRHDPDQVSDLLISAGFEIVSTTIRRAERYEKTPQAYLLAQLSQPRT